MDGFRWMKLLKVDEVIEGGVIETVIIYVLLSFSGK